MPGQVSLIPGCTVEGADAADEAFSLQAFEHTVDRGKRQRGHPLPQLPIHVFGFGMGRILRQQSIHGHPLRRNPNPSLMAQPLKILAPGVRVSRFAERTSWMSGIVSTNYHLIFITIWVGCRQAALDGKTGALLSHSSAPLPGRDTFHDPCPGVRYAHPGLFSMAPPEPKVPHGSRTKAHGIACRCFTVRFPVRCEVVQAACPGGAREI